VAQYLFHLSGEAGREEGAALLRVGMWGIRADERHRTALAPGDLIVISVGSTAREFIGRAVLASPVRDWTSSEAASYPGDSQSGVMLAQVEEWNPPVPVNAVLAQIDPAENARGDFPEGVVRISPHEYRSVLAVARPR
jgi:hypothetical protein